MAKAKLASNRSARWAFMDRFEVPDYDGDGNYLTRTRIIQTPWFGIYLHRFDGPDPRPTLHDHPWAFRSLVLRGGYVEAVAYSETATLPVNADRLRIHIPTESLRLHAEWRTLRPGSWNVKAATDRHTIVSLLRVPTWTLMLVGRRVREWGYIDRDGRWTVFHQHRHAAEFDAAMARRRARAS